MVGNNGCDGQEADPWYKATILVLTPCSSMVANKALFCFRSFGGFLMCKLKTSIL